MKHRVKMREDVGPDLRIGPQVIAREGEVYDVTLNGYGAVSAIVGGEHLGLRPDEFDFVCPLIEDGVTMLVNGQWRVYPRDRTGNWFALLEQVDGEWKWHRAELA